MKLSAILLPLIFAINLAAPTQATTFWPFKRSLSTSADVDKSVGEFCSAQHPLVKDRIGCLKNNICSPSARVGTIAWNLVGRGLASVVMGDNDPLINSDLTASIGSGVMTTSRYMFLASQIATIYGRDSYDESFFKEMGLDSIRAGIVDTFVTLGFYRGIRELTKQYSSYLLPTGAKILVETADSVSMAAFSVKEVWNAARCEGDIDALVNHVGPKLGKMKRTYV